MTVESKLPSLKAPKDMSLQNIVDEISIRERYRNIVADPHNPPGGIIFDDSRYIALRRELDNYTRKK